MATTMKSWKKDEMYDQYEEQFMKNMARGNIKSVEVNGFKFDTPMMSKQDFIGYLDEKLAQMSPSDSKKYKLGKLIFEESAVQVYSNKQIDHFRKNFDLNTMIEGPQKEELKSLLRKHSYYKDGKMIVPKEFIENNASTLLNLYFGGKGFVGDT